MWIIPVSVLERSYRVIYRRGLPFLERSCREWCAVGFHPHNERGNCVIVGKGSLELPQSLPNIRKSQRRISLFSTHDLGQDDFCRSLVIAKS
jgi:hypothetical protein